MCPRFDLRFYLYNHTPSRFKAITHITCSLIFQLILLYFYIDYADMGPENQYRVFNSMGQQVLLIQEGNQFKVKLV